VLFQGINIHKFSLVETKSQNPPSSEQKPTTAKTRQRELAVANAPNTKFRLASVTKQFTALCILMLQEQGKLSVEDPLAKFVPDCPPTWSAIKIRHLLTHTSGIPDYTGLADYRATVMLPWPPEKLLAQLRDKPLEFEPGARFAYSNSGYFLLSGIIARAAGRSYEQFLEQFIFQPLGMQDSGCDHFAAILPHRAAGYARDGDAWVNAAYTDTTFPQGDGALYSTVEDFFRWYQCWREHKLVSADSWKAMTTPVKEQYGFGIAVVKQFGLEELAHDGRCLGFTSSMRWFPAADVFVAVFANADSVDAGAVADNLAALLLDQPLRRPETRPTIKLAASQLEPLVGRYQFVENSGTITTVTASGDRLFMQTADLPKLEFLPESETNFFLKVQPAVQVTFWKNASGQVSRLVSQLNGVGHEAKRIQESDPGTK
jgi:CubicO group peptidase (beta-lactamase class C family)